MFSSVSSVINSLMLFRWGHLGLWLLALSVIGSSVEINALGAVWKTRTYSVPFVAIVLSATGLTLILVALVKRLSLVLVHGNQARFPDLFLVITTYASSIFVSAIVFRSLDTILRSDVFEVRYPSGIRLFDAIYLCSATISTVGYGDATPTHWFTRFLAMILAIFGLMLIAIVAAFVVGGILNRQSRAREERWFGGFQRRYFEAIERFHRTIYSKELEGLSDDEFVTLQRNWLSNIAHLVQLHLEPAPSAKIRANWMELYGGGDAPENAIALARQYTDPLLRTDEKMRTLWGILVMRDWDDKPIDMPGKDEFALPVYSPADANENRKQIVGAPQAVASEDGCAVVSDTSTINLDNQDDLVKEALRVYFAGRSTKVRSFASVRTSIGEKVLGVINIQSDEPDLCSATPEGQRIIVDMLRPFAQYFAVAWYERGKAKIKG